VAKQKFEVGQHVMVKWYDFKWREGVITGTVTKQGYDNRGCEYLKYSRVDFPDARPREILNSRAFVLSMDDYEQQIAPQLRARALAKRLSAKYQAGLTGLNLHRPW
jgi:hypothetical protein